MYSIVLRYSPVNKCAAGVLTLSHVYSSHLPPNHLCGVFTADLLLQLRDVVIRVPLDVLSVNGIRVTYTRHRHPKHDIVRYNSITQGEGRARANVNNPQLCLFKATLGRSPAGAILGISGASSWLFLLQRYNIDSTRQPSR